MKKLNNLKECISMCMTFGNLPTSYLESLTYEEQLIWFCKFLEETVIPAVNDNNEAVTELQGLFTQLQNHVDDYFDNLDVQEEINNKLEQMARSGELTRLIKNYVDPLIEEQNRAISTLQTNTETTLNNQNSSITELTGRVNSLSTLGEGSTTGDAELQDIRTGFNGVVYTNAGTAVRSQAKNNFDLATGIRKGVLIDSESITEDKLNVNEDLNIDEFTFNMNAGGPISAGFLTYIHDTAATEYRAVAKIICLTDIPSLIVNSVFGGSSSPYGEYSNLKQGDVIYIDNTLVKTTFSSSTIRLRFIMNNVTNAQSIKVINPHLYQDGTEQNLGTIGFENATSGTVTRVTKNYKALATKEYVDNAIEGNTGFNTLTFGCAGDSITAENGTQQWPSYVCYELLLNDKHNVAVGSATYADKKVIYNGNTYTPQNYSDANFAGYSTKSSTAATSELEAQQIANNCAKCHIEQFIAEVNNGTYEEPDIFIFAYGTNDNPNNLGDINTVFNTPLSEVDRNTLAGGMRYAIEKITTEYPNCKVFILNILQSAYSGYQSRENQILKNKTIKEVADYFSIPVLDQYNESGITRLYEVAGGQGRYLRDGLHPDNNGRKKQAEFIVRQLKNKTTKKIS